MNFANVYNQIIALFLLMASGYMFARLQFISKDTVENFTSFIVKIAMPALIIGGMMISKTPEKLKASGVILLISAVIYFFTFLMAKSVARMLRFKDSERGIYEFALMFSNVGFMGFPVIESIFGKEAIFFTAIYNIPFNILVYTVGIAMIKVSNEKQKMNMKVLFNPGVIASLIGFIIFLSPVAPPHAIKVAVNLVGSTTTPISMIVIGAMLSSVSTGQMFSNWKVYVVSLIRILIWPLVVFYIFRLILPIEDNILIGVPVIIAGMPVAANAAMMVQEYGSEPQVASQLIFITTLVSIITIPLLSLLFF